MTTHEGEPRGPRVIHTAQALVDEVVEVDALPVRGGNSVAQSYARYAGGAVNILVAAARSGADAVLAGAVGTGANGDLVRAALAAEGVAVSSPPVPDLDTGICFVMIEPSAERTFVTTQGAERRITVESLQTSAPVDGDLVCVSGFSLVGLTRDPLLSWLDGLAAGVVVVLDPGAAFADLAEDLRERVLARTTVWTSNADEAAQLTGLADPSAAADAVAGRLLSTERSRSCGTGRRDAGSAPAGGTGEPTYLAGYPQDAVDTNGAGDTHTGVLVACRAAGADWETAARRANAAGAIKVTRRGPATAPTAAEIDTFFEQAGPRPAGLDQQGRAEPARQPGGTTTARPAATWRAATTLAAAQTSDERAGPEHAWHPGERGEDRRVAATGARRPERTEVPPGAHEQHDPGRHQHLRLDGVVPPPPQRAGRGQRHQHDRGGEERTHPDQGQHPHAEQHGEHGRGPAPPRGPDQRGSDHRGGRVAGPGRDHPARGRARGRR